MSHVALTPSQAASFVERVEAWLAEWRQAFAGGPRAGGNQAQAQRRRRASAARHGDQMERQALRTNRPR